MERHQIVQSDNACVRAIETKQASHVTVPYPCVPKVTELERAVKNSVLMLT